MDRDRSDLHRRHLDLTCRRTLQIVRLLWAGDASVDPDAVRARREELQADLGRLDAELEAVYAELDGAPAPLDGLVQGAELSADETAIFLFLLAWRLYPEATAITDALRGLEGPLPVATVLRLLSPSTASRLRDRASFDPDGALLSSGLVVARSGGTAGLDEDVFERLVSVPAHVLMAALGETGLPAGLADWATLSRPTAGLDGVVLEPEARSRLEALLACWSAVPGAAPGANLLLLGGPMGTGKTRVAQAVAASLGRALLSLPGDALAGDASPSVRVRLEAAAAVARFHGALLLVDDADRVAAAGSLAAAELVTALARAPVPVILAVSDRHAVEPRLVESALVDVTLTAPDAPARRALWRARLDEDAAAAGKGNGDGAPLGPDAVERLAAQFRFTGAQIAKAAHIGAHLGAAASTGAPPAKQDAHPTADPIAVEAETYVRAGHALLPARMDQYAVRVPSRLGLDDLVVPDEQRAQLEELLAACRNRSWVFERWGFRETLTSGGGITAMFDGEPGTGKTLSAGIVAAVLGLPLYRISVAQVVDKYVGETEKHIERIFQTAHASQAVLLFDEADALFTKRVKVDSSNDRYANLQTNTLLTEIEAYEGIVLLTTNLAGNIDPAFLRRIHFRVHFPFPDADQRAEIWRKLLPDATPRDDSIDFEELGERFELSGGYIRNALLRGAYRARETGRPLDAEILEEVAALECRAAGKLYRGVTEPWSS